MAKRLFDFACAVALIVVVLPLMLATALAVRLALGAPVLLRQTRPGLGGVPFVFYKFRSMTDDRDANGELLPDEARLTRFGRWLRRSSLDELPQLLNVIKGDMSLVGPRPLLMEYLPLYTTEQVRRHQVRPGITGWAQVNGRNEITWEDRLSMDVWYVDHCSFALDLWILAMTLLQVVRRHGVSRTGHATMPRFSGSKPHGE